MVLAVAFGSPRIELRREYPSMQGWLICAKIPVSDRRDLHALYVTNVAEQVSAIEAVRLRIRASVDERLEVVRPATENELKGMRAGTVRNHTDY